MLLALIGLFPLTKWNENNVNNGWGLAFGVWSQNMYDLYFICNKMWKILRELFCIIHTTVLRWYKTMRRLSLIGCASFSYFEDVIAFFFLSLCCIKFVLIPHFVGDFHLNASVHHVCVCVCGSDLGDFDVTEDTSSYVFELNSFIFGIYHLVNQQSLCILSASLPHPSTHQLKWR